MRQFLLTAAFSFGCLLFAWPLLATPYRAALFGLVDVVFACVGESEVRIEAIAPDPGTKDDATLIRTEAEVGQEWQAPFNTRFVGYIPTALFVALCIATPWRTAKRRRRAWVRGLLGLHALILLHFAILFARGLTEHARTPGAAGHGHAEWLGSRAWFHTLDTLVTWSYGGGEPTTYLGLVVLLWVAVSFDREDWEVWLRRRPRPD